MSGHIHLHRKIRDSAVYQDSKTLHLWLELLLRASWKQGQLLNGVTLEPGQLICGQEELGESIGLSRREVRTRLQQLENCGNVTSKTTNAGTHITICNWATYQLLPDDERPAKRPASDQQATSKRPTRDQRATTEEEGKEGNKVIREDKTISPNKPAYSDGRIIDEEISRFVDAYNASGLPPLQRITKGRRDKIRGRLKDREWADAYPAAFEKLPLGGDGWQPDLDWLCKNETNLLKVLEGKYDFRNGNGNGNGKLDVDKLLSFSLDDYDE